MKKLLIICAAVLACATCGYIVSDVSSASIEDYRTDRRPFSWYYPYNYQYYYPRPHYYDNEMHGGSWNYTNGIYIYRGF